MRSAYYVFKLFNNIKIDSTLLLRTIGFIIGVCLFLINNPSYKKIKGRWQHCLKERKHLSWYEYLSCLLIYGVSPEEYVCYDFHNLNDRGKREYVTEFSREAIYKKCNKLSFTHFFTNKFETYTKFKPFYHREAFLLNKQTLPLDLTSFITRHEIFVCKPLKASLGKGVTIIDVKDYNDLEEVKNHLLNLTSNNAEYILEELIVQTPDIEVFHPQSVNTIRIPAFNTKEGVIIQGAFFRCGKGHNIVDNAGAGGILVAIDEKTGLLTTKGIDEKGNVYLKHPDSGVVFLGYQLPDWDSMLEMVTELMKIVPEIKYTGWDFAHTKNGWIVVEGNNKGQFVGQMPRQKGFVKDIEIILEKI